MSDDLGADVANVERLLRAIVSVEDKTHILREYLFDQTPEEYWPQLSISFGVVSESRATPFTDSLSAALAELERAATSDRDLRRLLVDLAAVVLKPIRPATEVPITRGSKVAR